MHAAPRRRSTVGLTAAAAALSAGGVLLLGLLGTMAVTGGGLPGTGDQDGLWRPGGVVIAAPAQAAEPPAPATGDEAQPVLRRPVAVVAADGVDVAVASEPVLTATPPPPAPTAPPVDRGRAAEPGRQKDSAGQLEPDRQDGSGRQDGKNGKNDKNGRNDKGAGSPPGRDADRVSASGSTAPGRSAEAPGRQAQRVTAAPGGTSAKGKPHQQLSVSGAVDSALTPPGRALGHQKVDGAHVPPGHARP